MRVEQTVHCHLEIQNRISHVSKPAFLETNNPIHSVHDITMLKSCCCIQPWLISGTIRRKAHVKKDIQACELLERESVEKVQTKLKIANICKSFVVSRCESQQHKSSIQKSRESAAPGTCRNVYVKRKVNIFERKISWRKITGLREQRELPFQSFSRILHAINNNSCS